MQKFRCLENSNKKEIKVEMFYAERRQDGKSDYVISGLQSSISIYICKVSGGKSLHSRVFAYFLTKWTREQRVNVRIDFT